ncbi:dihydrofolate reductase [Nonomuraea sp. PA05]|uniref:dihydrofolate reductase family protein n=1 Tax=Nonomuraea sp. PA05 TaxID=2604466 RepID=UPI0011D88E68|nr:dihydrofolate reductase family protein [Nonomuraea sp. PA05]TYB47343.1 dihydrofolate reductase [Nonomuraea sp. PA05]
MARIVSSFFISVDGVVESPDQWHFPYWNDEMGAMVQSGMDGAAGFLMGRKLYEEWSSYWTTTDADPEISARFNAAPKYVVTGSLKQADWANTTIVTGDPAARLREIKEQVEGDIQVSGSATTVRWLLAEGLLDELHLLVHPIVVGHGRRLFEDTPTRPLKLTGNETYQTGVLHLTYVPEAQAV